MPTPVFKIIPYRLGSAGAKNLKKGLEEYVSYDVAREDADYVLKTNEWGINWGAGHWRALRKNGATGTRIINHPERVCICVSKIDFFYLMDRHSVNIPKWTTSQGEATKWVKTGTAIYCRTTAEGKDGKGIVVAKKAEDVQWAPLYTEAIPATSEFRIHIFQNEPIFDLEKYHDNETKANSEVRSGGNGWQYTRDCKIPDRAKQEAVRAARALNMDFCAIDLLYNRNTGRATILEANSAPELGPWTRDAYARKLFALTK